MYRDLSRSTLSVLEVRAEQLQNISEEDAEAEGAEKAAEPGDLETQFPYDGEAGYDPFRCYLQGFENLWDSINASRGYGWKVNPWVWVVTFKVL